jgi:glycosyltransferase involved in cell wall biosynthesis
MEHFWSLLAAYFVTHDQKAFLAYPEITKLSKGVQSAPITAVELKLPWTNSDERKKALKFIRDNNIQAVYFTDQSYLSYQYAFLRKNGVKSIVVHDHTPGDRPPVKGVRGFLKAGRNFIPVITADWVLCVSELMHQRNLQNGRIPAAKSIVVQNGITPVQVNLDQSSELRDNVGLSSDSFAIITTGRANVYKRFDFVIDCADQLNRIAPESKALFILVGDGPAMPLLKEQVERLKIQKRVRLLGYREDIPQLLNAADIAFHAAMGEGFSLSIIEYMSAGLPVLVPDLPSVSQATDNEVTGFIYPVEDKSAVVDYILELESNKNRRMAMGCAAKNKADNEYSLERCSADFTGAISKCYSAGVQK